MDNPLLKCLAENKLLSYTNRVKILLCFNTEPKKNTYKKKAILLNQSDLRVSFLAVSQFQILAPYSWPNI